jgi:hypothetical protein
MTPTSKEEHEADLELVSANFRTSAIAKGRYFWSNHFCAYPKSHFIADDDRVDLTFDAENVSTLNNFLDARIQKGRPLPASSHHNDVENPLGHRKATSIPQLNIVIQIVGSRGVLYPQ